jgi:DNA helicase-2/ATP-dependent DNA helicase PcrA
VNSFSESYKQLNTAQKEAVDTIEGPVMVIAGPGTGKTQLLSVRVANILRKTDSDPSNILCLTFTNKAATNMRERLNSLIGPLSRNVVVRTFHSFAAEIMNQYPDYFWNGARLSIAPDAVQDDIIQTILARLPLDNPLATTFAGSYTALPDVKNALKLAKEAGLAPEDLQSIIKNNLIYIDKIEAKLCSILQPPLSSKKLSSLQKAIDSLPAQKVEEGSLLLSLSTVLKESLSLAISIDEQTGNTKETSKWKQRWVQTVDGKRSMFRERKRNEWWLAIVGVYQDYRSELHQRGYYDYSDMLIEVIEQLQREPELRADVQERFLYVLIDEFQDTNAAQLRLAHLVADHYAANGRPNLMTVGDDDQSIFAFNGAELNNMLSFQRSYPDTKVIVLKDNYRSSQPILDMSAQIIEQADDRLVKREASFNKNLTAKKPTAKKTDIKHLSYPTREHQFAGLSTQIQNLWKSGEKDIAVLARSNESLRQLASSLLHLNIPVRYDQQANILEHEAVKTVFLIAQIAVAINSGDRLKVNAGIAELVRHPMWKLSSKTLWKLAVKNYSDPDWLDSLLSNNDQVLSNVGHWLVWLARTSDQEPLPRIIDYILGLEEGQYLLSPFREYYLKQRPVTNTYIEALSAVQLLRSLTSEFASKQAMLTDYVHFIELNISTQRVIANESWFVSAKEAVQLLTIHKAKGLEFEHVFVVDAIESVWRPRSSRRASPANLQLQSYGENYDDYIRLLYVAASRAKRSFITTSYATDEHGNELLPTPLLASLPIEIVTNPLEAPVKVLESNLRWPGLESKDEHAILHSLLEDFSLSPTAFIDFVNVAEAGPQSFKERHLLRVPRPHSATGSYGVAIHAALETAQRLINTKKLDIGTVLDRFEATLVSEHLSPIDYARYQIRGEQLLKSVLKHSNELVPKGGIAEQRIDNITLGTARLKGKLDRLNVINDSVIISDYKTGKPLSSFETQDKTKTVKAWRHKTQLLFYALLVQSSARFSGKVTSSQMIYLESEHQKNMTLQLVPSPENLAHLEKLIAVVWKHIMNLDFPDTTAYSKDINGIREFEEDLLKNKL